MIPFCLQCSSGVVREGGQLQSWVWADFDDFLGVARASIYDDGAAAAGIDMILGSKSCP